jgi:anti-anti-sigma factor
VTSEVIVKLPDQTPDDVAGQLPDHIPADIASQLRIAITEQGRTITVALGGEWDIAEQEATRTATLSALERYPERLVLDLSQLTFIDSSGLRVAVELQKRSRRQNTRLVVVPGSPAAQRLLEMCQLNEVVPFTPPS